MPDHSAPLWLCFLAQTMSVAGDAFGQRTARVHHHSSRRRFLISMTAISCVQMFVALSIIQLAQFSFTKSVFLDNTTKYKTFNATTNITTTTKFERQYDYCDVHPDDEEHCYYQGPLTLYKEIATCPLILVLLAIKVLYYIGEAVLFSQPLGLLLLVMASLSSAFILAPVQKALNVGTAGPIPVGVIILGILGAIFCVAERNVKHKNTNEEDGEGGEPKEMEMQTDFDFQKLAERFIPFSSNHPSTSAFGANRRRRSIIVITLQRAFPAPSLVIGFVLLSLTYASIFLLMVTYNDDCKINPWGFNAFDQVAFPPVLYFVFFIIDSFQFTRTRFDSEDDQKESFRECVVTAWREATANRCQGMLTAFVFRMLVNGRALIYTYLAIIYDLDKVYLELTLIRVALSWVGSVILVVVAPSFIQTSQEEKAAIFDVVNLSLKMVGTVCIVVALVMMT